MYKSGNSRARELLKHSASCRSTAIVIHFRAIGVSVAEMKIEMDTGRKDELHSLTCRRNVKNIQLSTIRIDGKQPLHFANTD